MTGNQEANRKRNYNNTLRNCCSVLNIIDVIKSKNTKRNINLGGE